MYLLLNNTLRYRYFSKLFNSNRKMSTEDKLHASNNDINSRLIWLDLELSGLDIEKDVILEVACVITEANLQEVGERFNAVIHHPPKILDNMGSWCKEHHLKTGLITEVKESITTVKEAENQLISYVEKYTPSGKCCLSGNTIYMDRLFVSKYFPTFSEHLHYRLIDVSTIKELCRRWNRDLYLNAPQKVFVHRALDDILESINELRYYKKVIFNSNDVSKN